MRNNRQERIGRTTPIAFAMLQHMKAPVRKTEVYALQQARFDARRGD